MRQKELFKEEIIHQLELHPSRLDKEKIISEAMEDGLDDFFEGIRMALDPLVTFGVKIVPEKKNEKSQNFLWKDFRVLANKLIQRELTYWSRCSRCNYYGYGICQKRRVEWIL